MAAPMHFPPSTIPPRSRHMSVNRKSAAKFANANAAPRIAMPKIAVDVAQFIEPVI